MLKNIVIIMLLLVVRIFVIFFHITEKYSILCVPLTYFSIMMLYFLERNILSKLFISSKKYKHILIIVNTLFALLYTVCVLDDYVALTWR